VIHQARLAAFGRWCLDQLYYSVGGDLDGGDAQDEAERLGLLVRVPMDGPCGENCACVEFHGDPPWECLREVDASASTVPTPGEQGGPDPASQSSPQPQDQSEPKEKA